MARRPVRRQFERRGAGLPTQFRRLELPADERPGTPIPGLLPKLDRVFRAVGHRKAVRNPERHPDRFSGMHEGVCADFQGRLLADRLVSHPPIRNLTRFVLPLFHREGRVPMLRTGIEPLRKTGTYEIPACGPARGPVHQVVPDLPVTVIGRRAVDRKRRGERSAPCRKGRHPSRAEPFDRQHRESVFRFHQHLGAIAWLELLGLHAGRQRLQRHSVGNRMLVDRPPG